ncbi:hypothetical protein T440DRAFT_442650 [Plenodomus tracheiphilus IPT5]|uniref:Heterokaryon incompatibility domain-containing protein n=1 Tax=Plenodomus tracheiphilus IPT5 TaxID=1408161 RepID=A0A6A7BFF7_9PLEO|nr:hypothetical protein T440DRAFT_442650 [Plenodomus tracheiphilus IPT5]
MILVRALFKETIKRSLRFDTYHGPRHHTTYEILQSSRLPRLFHTATSEIYGNLDHTKSEIRVLKIEPGRWDDDISCKLKVISLDRLLEPRYDTLSYTWGSSESTSSIIVNGRTIAVSTNLFTALRALRRTSMTATIWADALCIDQKNNSEKSRQVALMGRIYKKGRQTWVSLGCPDERATGLEDSLDDPGQQHQKMAASMLTWIATHEYWSRVWIVQEIALSQKDPICLFGRHQVPLLALDTVFSDWTDGGFLSQAWQRAGWSPEIGKGVARVEEICLLRDEFLSMWTLRLTGSMELLRTLQFASYRRASIPHDHIYGLLSLLPANEQQLLEPD